MKRFFVVILALLLFLPACETEQEPSAINNLDEPALDPVIPPAQGRYGMVSSAHPLATEAGLKILKEGGNAFDAAVAIGAVLTVVEPMMSSMGGYGTILIYDAETGTTRFLDASGRIPAAVDADVFRPPTPGYQENRYGPMAISTPGVVNAWQALSSEYGELEWQELFGPAITYAANGFEVYDQLGAMIADSYQYFGDYERSIYGQSGQPVAVGDLLVQEELARAFQRIAEGGAEVFYQGEIGKGIDDVMRASGGFLRLEDLRQDKAEFWEPIHINYRGFEVYTASPPATAFPSLLRLGLMSHFEVASMGHNSVYNLHFFIESTKHAFWARLKYAGDPEISPPPLDKLLSQEYWTEIASGFEPDQAQPFRYPGEAQAAQQHTTHFVVADSAGNIVSATQTLGGGFGSRIMVPEYGIWMNNSLSYCTFEPAGNPMDAIPGQRKLSGDCPTIVFKDGLPVIALGTPGGHTIGQTVPQMVMNLIDFDMDIQQALSQSKLAFVEPDTIYFEYGIDEEIIEQLREYGHKIEIMEEGDSLSNAHGLMIAYDENGKPILFTGGSDIRGHGLAKGY